MERYLKNTLGLHAEINTWNYESELPEVLKEGKEYSVLTLSGVQCLLIKENSSDFQISSYLKEKEMLTNLCKFPQVLNFDRINSYQRKCLIENGISFVVPDNQLYVPFMGIALQEHFKAQTVAGTQLTAMAQYILLYLIYDRSGKYHSKLDISKFLDINLMNVSRGVQELEELHLLETRKKGRSSMVVNDVTAKELYHNASAYMRNPVQKRMFVKAEEWLLELPIAGKEAINFLQSFDDNGERQTHRTRAIEKRMYLDNTEKICEVDPAWDKNVEYIELEVWRYDPARFTDGKIVDSISLALSSGGEDIDELKMNIDKLLD